MTLKVIGTGFGRTGTDSMRVALNQLGVGPTHHMTLINEVTGARDHWLKLVNGGVPDWDVLFRGYNSCVDWPSAFYWRAIVDAYPDAKVLLTMRPAESWWKSFEATILKHILGSDDLTGFSHRLVAQQVFHGRPHDREHAISVYQQNVKDVLAYVSPERLLVHNLGDGWEPLCQWLDVPTPETPYPNGNTTEEFNRRISS